MSHQSTRSLVFVLACAVLGIASATSAYAAPTCTAQQGQLLIDAGRYKQAVNEFTCVIVADPTGIEGYRGRIEAQLLLGQYSNAFRDYARVTAVVTPVHPDAESIILAGYAARLETAPDDITALVGASFARWAYFDYLGASMCSITSSILIPRTLTVTCFAARAGCSKVTR